MEKNTPLPEQNGNTPASDKANASSTPSFLVSEEEEKALQERNEEKALAKKQQLKKNHHLCPNGDNLPRLYVSAFWWRK